jgi:hypothetical protein
VRNFLLLLGWWQPILALFSAIAVFAWSHVKQLSGPVAFALALFTLASVLELSIRLPEIFRRKVRVRLSPAKGPDLIQLLNVENLGEPVTLRAHCTLLNRRNDPNQLHYSTFPMEWDAPQKRAVELRRGDSCNLVVARADRGPAPDDMAWIEICGLSADDKRETKENSRWYRGDNLPEYDLQITIIGENHRPHVECFTLRAGRTSALEMFAIPCPKNGALSRHLDSAT